ncbi:hypothetical protein EU546_00395 [Candidatus Thorarchaeota archaeon]|nr:MAG: hypothetical protein EU546_00395 [Candidatus Thorarchaeota archaeon]
MTVCEECKRYGLSRTNQVAFPCALCGEMRCEDHAIWVPAHELGKPEDEIKALKKKLREKPAGGWYVFCGRPSHLPRGVPTRFGPEKSGGRMVRALFDYEKKPGLEVFKRWETGIIEDGYEKEWEPNQFTPSCSFTATMVIIANKASEAAGSMEELHRFYMLAFQTLANKKENFINATWEDFLKEAGEHPSIQRIMEFTCSRCAVLICANRLAPFFDKGLFKNLIQSPELLQDGQQE